MDFSRQIPNLAVKVEKLREAHASAVHWAEELWALDFPAWNHPGTDALAFAVAVGRRLEVYEAALQRESDDSPADSAAPCEEEAK